MQHYWKEDPINGCQVGTKCPIQAERAAVLYAAEAARLEAEVQAQVRATRLPSLKSYREHRGARRERGSHKKRRSSGDDGALAGASHCCDEQEARLVLFDVCNRILRRCLAAMHRILEGCVRGARRTWADTNQA
jgi:hypothetical protein